MLLVGFWATISRENAVLISVIGIAAMAALAALQINYAGNNVEPGEKTLKLTEVEPSKFLEEAERGERTGAKALGWGMLTGLGISVLVGTVLIAIRP